MTTSLGGPHGSRFSTFWEHRNFAGSNFDVNPAVLIPRPETELLVQEVIRRLTRGGRPTVVDVGTGSGCVAVTLARALSSARIFATDFSVQALETAKRNASRHGVDTTICWLEGDLLAPLAEREVATAR